MHDHVKQLQNNNLNKLKMKLFARFVTSEFNNQNIIKTFQANINVLEKGRYVFQYLKKKEFERAFPLQKVFPLQPVQ